ncbi:hypothetical protein QBC44DRAFT_311923 [Cladorrhinum sp. PSN332]|nr:hypothetical protein QBC44DRAFT_311923 [Cladorrhinum sp. PSN332]
MAPDTFHPFPMLPTELRLMIWKRAIRPKSGGIHRFSVIDLRRDENVRKPLALQGSRCSLSPMYLPVPGHKALGPPRVINTLQEFSWIRNNSSAYLWDPGLWIACKESRMVFMEQTNKLPPCPPSAPSNLCYGLDEATFDGIHATCTVVIPSSISNQELHLMVQPTYDLLLLDSESLDVLFGDEISLSDWNAVYICFGPSMIMGRFGDIAVEFDPSWSVGLPQKSSGPSDINPDASAAITGFEQLCQEHTPRGYLSWLIRESVQLGPCGSLPSIRLMDYKSTLRGVECSPRESQAEMFYDCGQEYVSIEAPLNYANSPGEDMGSSLAVDFLERFKILVDDWLVEGEAQLNDYWAWGKDKDASRAKFSVWEIIHVLVPKRDSRLILRQE